jgi:SAM-dependent methyltransferase
MKTMNKTVHLIEIAACCGPEIFSTLSGGDYLGRIPKERPLEVVRCDRAFRWNGGKIAEAKAFGFVRNPWSRVIAEIRYFQQNFMGVFPYAEMKRNVRRYVEKAGDVDFERLQSQVKILGEHALAGGLFFVGRVEHLRDDLEVLRQELEIGVVTLPNAPKLERAGEHYGQFFDQESAGWVAELYADDIAVFGYEFEESGLEHERAQQKPLLGRSVGEALAWGLEIRLARAERGVQFAGKYEGGSTGDWYAHSFNLWMRAFSSVEALKVLDIGSGCGVSANVLLEAVTTHRKTELHCVENFEGLDESESEELAMFLRNQKLGGHFKQIELYEGGAAEILSWMAVEEGYWESFDLVMVRGGSRAPEVLSSACRAFDLLKPGGRIIFGPFLEVGKNHPELAEEAFISIFGSEFWAEETGGRTILTKRLDAVSEAKQYVNR